MLKIPIRLVGSTANSFDKELKADKITGVSSRIQLKTISENVTKCEAYNI